jgi:hypothetical protein
MTTTLATKARDALVLPPWMTEPEPLPVSQRPTRVELAGSQRATTLDRIAPQSVRVPGISRDIEVKIASERQEWEEAYQLVGQNYRSRGYEAADAQGLRFTAFHALPDTTTFVAKHNGHVVATLSLVVDNTLLGLPMECIYGPEIHDLRLQGRRMGEATSLADSGLGVREFLQVFVTIIKLTMQHHVRHGGDTWVITVNPRHRAFYTKVLGFVPLGPCRSYPCVQDAPAEAYRLDLDVMKANAPQMYETMFGQDLPEAVLRAPRMDANLVRHFGSNSTQTSVRQVQDVLDYVHHYGSPRRW